MTSRTRPPSNPPRASAVASMTFWDGSKPSQNVGRVKSGLRRQASLVPDRADGESQQHTPRSDKRRGAEHGGSHATNARPVHSSLAEEWAGKHNATLDEREKLARSAALRSGKPWTLHADQQTQAILADCPTRSVSEATAAEYRRTYDNLKARGLTPWEAASTRNHWDKLRTASRFCMEQDIRTWRAASERARKRGDIASAKRRTERGFRLATVLDEMFMQPDRKTWLHKAAEMKAAGNSPSSKSKRTTMAPAPDMAGVALLTGRRHGTKVADRHAERLALVALFSMRPAELKKGVQLAVVDGGRFLTAQVAGSKVNHARGQEVRVIRVPIEGCAAVGLAEAVKANGGKWTLQTTDADHRSLNRALRGGLSCYSFRHQTGSDLKEAVATGVITAEEAAAVMGHRSTASLFAYGSRSRARGGRRPRANASASVRTISVSYEARAEARAEKAKAKAATGRLRASASPQAQPKAAPKAAPLQRVNLKPKSPRM